MIHSTYDMTMRYESNRAKPQEVCCQNRHEGVAMSCPFQAYWFMLRDQPGSVHDGWNMETTTRLIVQPHRTTPTTCLQGILAAEEPVRF